MISSAIQCILGLSIISKLLLVVGLLFLSLIGVVFYKVYWVPKRITKFYTSQGIKTCFFEGIDPNKTWKELALKNGDCFYPWTEFVRKNPDASVFVDNMGPFVDLQIVDPKYVKEYFQKEDECYKRGMVFDILTLMFDDSLGLMPYDVWKARRRLYSQSFHYEFLKNNLYAIENQAIRFCNNVHPSGLPKFIALKETKDYTGSVMAQVFFGKDVSGEMIEGEPFIHCLSEFCEDGLKNITSPLVLMFGAKIIKARLLSSHREFFRRKAVIQAACKKLVLQNLEEWKKTGDSNKSPNNLLEVFIKGKEDPETKLTDDSIGKEFMGFFFAGTDTTSFLLSVAFYHLASRPEEAKKIRDEIIANWKIGQSLTMDVINRMEYLYAFLKEVSRFSSAIFNVGQREAIKDHQLLDIKIKKGTTVVVGYRTMSTNPKFYKNPDEFDPERFLKKDPEEKFNSDPFIYVPFSAGKKNCLGQHLAMLEARVLLIHMLMRYDMELPKDYKFQLCLIDAMYVPIQPVELKLTPRT